MITIKNLLNKIKWDNNLNPEDYSLLVFDRITKKLTEIKYKDIKRTEGNFLILEEAEIPMHRVRKVLKKGKIIWERG
jgi:uncharacterized protein (UPF0248 family)